MRKQAYLQDYSLYYNEKMKCGIFSIIPHAHVKNEVMTSLHGELQRETPNKDAMAEM